MTCRIGNGSGTEAFRQVDEPAISLTGPSGDDARAQRAGLGVRAAEDDRHARPHADAPGDRRLKLPDRLGRWAHRRKEVRAEPDRLLQIGRPRPLPQVEHERCRGVRPIGRHLAGQGVRDEVPGLQCTARPVKRRGLVRLQPEELRRDMEGGRQVSGPRVDRGVAESLANGRRLCRRPIVAVDQPGTDGPAIRVDQADRWALPGEADGRDSLACSQLADQGLEGRERRPSPRPRILLRPARGDRFGRVALPDFEEPVALEPERGGARTGRPDVDRDQDLGPRHRR